MFIKLCGFTRIEDIETIRPLPVSAAGFIFYKKSPRYVSPEKAAILSAALNGSGIETVGVFVDDTPDEILDAVRIARLDRVQVYSEYNARALAPAIPVIQCVRVGEEEITSLPEPLPGGMVLFDTYSPSSFGGTGVGFDHALIRDYPFRGRMIIAGGVNERNVNSIITELRPGGVDISSGIEVSAGIKSPEKILNIMRLIKEAKNEITA